jgi:pSer/pThr/pTyr-binding forkhead associated (FHA) protein
VPGQIYGGVIGKEATDMSIPPSESSRQSDPEDPGDKGGVSLTDATMSLGAVAPGETDAESGATAVEQAAVEALPAGSALLVVRRGPNTGARFLLDRDRTTAGRRSDSDIFLDDVTVSRRHAEFVRRGQGFLVRDVGSLNGTYVNRDRIEEAGLRAGDEVQIGKYRMVFFPSPRDGGVDAGR